MQNWKSVTVRLKEEDIALLNQRLKQSGFSSLGGFVRAFTQGIITNDRLVEPLAEKVADRIVVKMSTSRPMITTIPAHETDKACGRRDLNPGYKLGGLVS